MTDQESNRCQTFIQYLQSFADVFAVCAKLQPVVNLQTKANRV